MEFLRRIAALIPPSRFHNIRYHGLFAVAAKDRANACALTPPVDDADNADENASDGRRNRPRDGAHAASVDTAAAAIATGTSNSPDDPDRDAPYRQRRRIEWARLLRQVFAVDVLRCPCGGERKIIAALTRSDSPKGLRRYLETTGHTPDPRDSIDPMPDWDAHFAD